LIKFQFANEFVLFLGYIMKTPPSKAFMSLKAKMKPPSIDIQKLGQCIESHGLFTVRCTWLFAYLLLIQIHRDSQQSLEFRFAVIQL